MKNGYDTEDLLEPIVQRWSNGWSSWVFRILVTVICKLFSFGYSFSAPLATCHMQSLTPASVALCREDMSLEKSVFRVPPNWLVNVALRVSGYETTCGKSSFPKVPVNKTSQQTNPNPGPI